MAWTLLMAGWLLSSSPEDSVFHPLSKPAEWTSPGEAERLECAYELTAPRSFERCFLG